MSKHLESLHQNLLNGKLPHNLSWSEAVELVEHLGEVQPHGDDEFVFRVGTQRVFFKKPQTHAFRGPAYYDFDFALIKTTPFGYRESGLERAALQFRAELFNLFNIVNMGLPANLIEGTGFGMISKTAGTSRQIQFSLKLIY